MVGLEIGFVVSKIDIGQTQDFYFLWYAFHPAENGGNYFNVINFSI